MNDEIEDLKQAAEAALKREPRDLVARNVLRFLKERDPANSRHQAILAQIMGAWEKARQQERARALKPMRIAIRGYAFEGETMRTVFDERAEISGDLHEIGDLAQRHALRMLDSPQNMVEIEFLDETNPLERFFRIGTDPTGMVVPVEIRLDDEKVQ